MSLKAGCPKCSEKIRIASVALGERAKCPRCEHRFRLYVSCLVNGNRLEDSENWHLRRQSGEQEGPLDFAQVQKRVAAGELQTGSQIWHSGWPEWKWADDLFETLRPPENAKAQSVDVPERDESAGASTIDLFAMPELQEAPASSAASSLKIRPNEPRVPKGGKSSSATRGDSVESSTSKKGSTLSPILRRAVADTTAWIIVVLALCGLAAGVLGIAGGVLAVLVAMGRSGGGGWLVALLIAAAAAAPLPALWRFHKRCAEFASAGEESRLLQVLEAQRRVWKMAALVPLGLACLCGILVVVSLLSGLGWFFAG